MAFIRDGLREPFKKSCVVRDVASFDSVSACYSLYHLSLVVGHNNGQAIHFPGEDPLFVVKPVYEGLAFRVFHFIERQSLLCVLYLF